MPRVPMWRRYARLFGADSKADVSDELRFHLDSKTEDLIAQGWSRQAARREAERQFGDVKAIQQTGVRMNDELHNNARRHEYRSELGQDFRYALRTLRKDRGFAVVAVLILAIAIAANTTVFSLVDAVVLRPLPFPQSEQLVWMSSDKSLPPQIREAAGLSAVTYTVAAFEEFQRHNHSFASITSYNPFFGNSEYTLTGHGEAQPVVGVMVAGNFFQTLGVEPALGRLYVKEEFQKGGRPAVLLSNSFWRRQFNSDPSIVGQPITLSKQAATVVGVLPPTFDFGSIFAPGMRVDVFAAFALDDLRNWGNTLAVVGRLKPGVSVGQAQAEADILFPQFKQAHKDWWIDYASTLSGLKQYVSGKIHRSLMLLWGAVAVVLLIVCVNLSNLQLARAAARTKEFALRSALGAGRGRLFRQLLTENLLLACTGAIIGLLFAYAVTFYLSHQETIALPLLSTVTVDRSALAWTLLVTFAAALLFGIIPGLRMSSGNIQDALKDSGHGLTTGRKHETLRGVMVISEVALACVLLVNAGLLLRSFLKILDVDLGFRPSRAAVIKIDYDGSTPERRGAALRQIQQSILQIPGIEAAGITDMLPLGRNRAWGLEAKGVQYDKNEALVAFVRIVTPGYLPAMEMNLREGRDFNWADAPKSTPVVIVNSAAARQFWRGQDPVGRIALINGRETTVIGVLSNIRETTLEGAVAPEMYLPVTQADPEGGELVVRTKLPPDALAGTVMRTLRSLNPNQPASEFRPLQDMVDRAVSPRRFFVVLAGAFAIVGLVLASLGIYGVISYSVTCQTQEIGVRMALGANRLQVQGGVVLRAMRFAIAGILLGSAVCLVVTRWLESLLYGTKPLDSLTFAATIALLGLVALVAGYIPARRASRIDPMVALRNS